MIDSSGLIFVLNLDFRHTIFFSSEFLFPPTLFFWGGLDAHIGPDAVTAVNNALRAEKKTWINAEFSFADHGFFCDARASYNAEAAKEAWALTLTFLGTHAN